MKALFFISTGRCGTHRIHEILGEKLPSFKVIHHIQFSRIIYMIGNFMFIFGQINFIKKLLFKFLLSRSIGVNDKLISIDGRICFIIPDEYIKRKDVKIVHIGRENKSFAESMFKFSRFNIKNLIAHNLIPFWQLFLFPFENVLNRNVLKKYEKISRVKNEYFKNKYSLNPYYEYFDYKEIFQDTILQDLVNNAFGTKIKIAPEELNIRANAS